MLSEAGDPERAAAALAAVRQRLIDRNLGVVRLFDPPFDAAPWDPGYIKGYAPGLRENGAQYTHAAVWVAMAHAALRKSEEAWALVRMLNPLSRAATREAAAVYRVEPYVMPADVYTARGHEGRGGWTWYTGSAGWMYQLLVERLLGLHVEGDMLRFVPLFPREWTEYTLHYRHRRTFYHMRVRKTGADTWNVRRVTLDGVDQPDLTVHLADDGREHHGEVEAGQPPAETECAAEINLIQFSWANTPIDPTSHDAS